MSAHSYCRRDGWECEPGERCDEHRRREVQRLFPTQSVPGAPWSPREWAVFRAGYDLGWKQGYHDGGPDD